MERQFALGIDLGTSNCALALARPADLKPELVSVTQLTQPGSAAEELLFPSALYLPHEGECSPESLRLPWMTGTPSYALGQWARGRGSLAPDRLVASAKSWLSNYHVDRKGAILPWQSDSVSLKISPFEASRLYLEHLRESLQYLRRVSPDDCLIILTVPASFDETARALTHEAAAAAGWGQVTLLEEPQAAFYSWIAQHADESGAEGWRTLVQPGDLVLVCDLGGGTADFSLIAVTEDAGTLRLERVSVGQHLLLGGDNMDLALAFRIKEQLEAEGQAIDDWQFLALIHASRSAKERIFSDEAPADAPIAVPSRGRSLFAQTISARLTKDTAHDVVLDGFFPLTNVDDLPEAGRLSGLRELGLPFAADPVVSKHLAQFLRSSLTNVRSDSKLSALVGESRIHQAKLLCPSAVLFNGGVFRAAALRSRVLELIRSWDSAAEIRELHSADLDLAVARGAAYYGAVALNGKGLKIRSGLSRSYYLGLETSMPAVPGIRPKIKGLCVAPQGVEEGRRLELPEAEFGLVVGQPVEFRFFSSAERAGDAMGTVVADAQAALEETSRIGATLDADGSRADPGTVLPVTLSCDVTEMGTLELWLEHRASGRRWRLEFNVRPS